MLGDSIFHINQISLGRMPLEFPTKTLFLFLLCKLLKENTGLYKRVFSAYVNQVLMVLFLFLRQENEETILFCKDWMNHLTA